MNSQVEDLIRENNNLIYSICTKYEAYSDIEDLYQVGVIGLMKALDNYKANLGVKFSTYAFPYIVGEISKYSRENKNIKVGKDLLRLGKKLNEYIDKYFEVRGHKPSIEEIAKTFDLKEEKVISALEANNRIKSLDEEINDDGKMRTLMDVTADTRMINSEELIDLKEAFSTLSDEEKSLIINRYYNDLTQSEVANILGVNQVYVSRLEKKTLSKMKSLMY